MSKLQWKNKMPGGKVSVNLHMPAELLRVIDEFTERTRRHFDEHSSKFTKEEIEQVITHAKKTTRSEAHLMAREIYRVKMIGVRNHRISRHNIILELISTGMSFSTPTPEVYSLRQVQEAIDAVQPPPTV